MVPSGACPPPYQIGPQTRQEPPARPSWCPSRVPPGQLQPRQWPGAHDFSVYQDQGRPLARKHLTDSTRPVSVAAMLPMRLLVLIIAVFAIAGCDTELDRPSRSDRESIAGTYERWLWSHGPTGPDNPHLKYKSVFGNDGIYYRFGLVTISFRQYDYDIENIRLRFGTEITYSDGSTEIIWSNWLDMKWYNDDTFCIVNERCYRKVDEFTGPNNPTG